MAFNICIRQRELDKLGRVCGDFYQTCSACTNVPTVRGVRPALCPAAHRLSAGATPTPHFTGTGSVGDPDPGRAAALPVDISTAMLGTRHHPSCAVTELSVGPQWGLQLPTDLWDEADQAELPDEADLDEALGVAPAPERPGPRHSPSPSETEGAAADPAGAAPSAAGSPWRPAARLAPRAQWPSLAGDDGLWPPAAGEAAGPSLTAIYEHHPALRKYKTCTCHKFEQTGKCPYGERCLYAHGEGELRSEQDNLNTFMTIAHLKEELHVLQQEINSLLTQVPVGMMMGAGAPPPARRAVGLRPSVLPEPAQGMGGVACGSDPLFFNSPFAGGLFNATECFGGLQRV